MLPLGTAIVSLMDPPMTRAAAVVYRTRTGLAWVEPGYWDAFPPPSPQFHEVEGAVTDTDDGVFLQSATQQVLMLDSERVKGKENGEPQIQRELQAFRARLAELGTTLEEERIKLAAELPVSG